MPVVSPTHERIRGLVPLRFQALATLLARRVYGEPFHDIRDTAGEGNGCDGVRVYPEHSHGFQARTIEHELGEGQRAKMRSAVTLAKEPWDFVLDHIVRKYELRTIRDGNRIRISRP